MGREEGRAGSRLSLPSLRLLRSHSGSVRRRLNDVAPRSKHNIDELQSSSEGSEIP